MEHAYNSSSQEDEAGGFRVQNQPGIHSENFSQKSKNLIKRKERMGRLERWLSG